MDFLQFHTEAVNSVGNRTMKETISRCAANETNESLAFIVPLIRRAEKPASWVHFPPLSEHDDDSSPISHTRKPLLVWLFHQFALPVCTTKNKKADSAKYESDGIQKVDVRSVLEDMSIDDMTFIFVQVQHNIAKWNLMYCAYKQKSIHAWKDKESIEECEFDRKMTATDQQRIGAINKYGYEYPTGSGVAGNDGKRRYNAMFKYFYRHFFDKDNPARSENRMVIFDAVAELVAKEAEMEMEAQQESGAGVPGNDPRKAKKQKSDQVTDLYLQQALASVAFPWAV